MALIAAALLLRRARSTDRRGAIGAAAIYALFLAPPLLARATVSVLHRPSMRQIYLPLIGDVSPAYEALGFARAGRWGRFLRAFAGL